VLLFCNIDFRYERANGRLYTTNGGYHRLRTGKRVVLTTRVGVGGQVDEHQEGLSDATSTKLERLEPACRSFGHSAASENDTLPLAGRDNTP